jgi:uncharacterized protein
MWRPRLIVLQPTPYCNINCDYCYLRNRDDRAVMSADVVGAIRDKIFSNISPDAAPTVIWHAGEPTVVPIEWYRRVDAQLRARAPAQTKFSLQSNGIFLSEDWISFLKGTQTHIGLSIDGPEAIHDLRRKTRSGHGTWALAIKTLDKLQDAGIWPSVVSVLHPRSLAMADEYFDFYREHAVAHVSFSIDEAEGCHSVSSFGQGDYKSAVTDFLFYLLKRAFIERHPLHIKEVERVADILVRGAADNEQVNPWDVIVVAANGDVTTFSPEFMEVRSPFHDNFRFGNILEDDFEGLLAKALVAMTHAQIRNGVELCRADCVYFSVCGGGAPANKFQETGSLETTETQFCRLSIQTAAEALRKFLQWSAAPAARAERGAAGFREFSKVAAM